MEATITLHLLGPVQLCWNGTPVQGFESRKALALLCYLAEQEHPISRSQLVHLFWGDKSEARGRGNLSRVLHNNLVLLPDCLETTRDYIEFVRSPAHQVDIATFVELAAQKDLSALLEAVNLYRGDFMADFTLPDSPEFEAWLITEQEMWHRRMTAVLHTIVTHYSNSGNYEAGLHFAERLLSLDPWQEEAHRQMMAMLALSGQRVAALSQYESCQRILADELGVKPSAETTTLYEHIREVKTVNRSLPLFATSEFSKSPFENSPLIDLSDFQNLTNLDRTNLFINSGFHDDELDSLSSSTEEHGSYSAVTPVRPSVYKCIRQERERDLAQITERLVSPSCRLLTLVGSDTQAMRELVMELMRRESHSFQHGVYFASAGDSSAAFLINSLLHKLDVTGYEVDEPLLAIYKYVRDKEMLVILHDVHKQSDGVTLLEDILKRAPMLKILVTAPEALNLSSEWIFDIG